MSSAPPEQDAIASLRFAPRLRLPTGPFGHRNRNVESADSALLAQQPGHQFPLLEQQQQRTRTVHAPRPPSSLAPCLSTKEDASPPPFRMHLEDSDSTKRRRSSSQCGAQGEEGDQTTPVLFLSIDQDDNDHDPKILDRINLIETDARNEASVLGITATTAPQESQPNQKPPLSNNTRRASASRNLSGGLLDEEQLLQWSVRSASCVDARVLEKLASWSSPSPTPAELFQQLERSQRQQREDEFMATSQRRTSASHPSVEPTVTRKVTVNENENTTSSKRVVLAEFEDMNNPAPRCTFDPLPHADADDDDHASSPMQVTPGERSIFSFSTFGSQSTVNFFRTAQHLERVAPAFTSDVTYRCVERIVDPDTGLLTRQEFKPCDTTVALMFVDITGYSELTRRLSEGAHNNSGAYVLTEVVNLYFCKIIRLVSEFGGDVIKFAGDALVAVWEAHRMLETGEAIFLLPHDKTISLKHSADAVKVHPFALKRACERATECALEIQRRCGSFHHKESNVTLRLHIGVTAGQLHGEVFFSPSALSNAQEKGDGTAEEAIGILLAASQQLKGGSSSEVPLMPSAFFFLGGDALSSIDQCVALARSGEVCISTVVEACLDLPVSHNVRSPRPASALSTPGHVAPVVPPSSSNDGAHNPSPPLVSCVRKLTAMKHVVGPFKRGLDVNPHNNSSDDAVVATTPLDASSLLWEPEVVGTPEDPYERLLIDRMLPEDPKFLPSIVDAAVPFSSMAFDVVSYAQANFTFAITPSIDAASLVRLLDGSASFKNKNPTSNTTFSDLRFVGILPRVACRIAQDLGWFLSKQCHIDPRVFLRFALAVEAGYRLVPYHNAIHAADVMHAMYVFLVTVPSHQLGKPLSSLFTPVELVAALIAAMVHDIGHPGRGNNFIAGWSRVQCATAETKSSLLERHHITRALKLLDHPLLDITQKFAHSEDRSKFREVLNIIMATDFAVHSEVVDDLEKLPAKGTSPGGWSISHNEQERLVLLRALIHGADWGGFAKEPAKGLMHWVRSITMEFQNQGKEEEALGLPVNPNGKPTAQSVTKSQLFMARHMVIPLYEQIGRVAGDAVVADSIRLVQAASSYIEGCLERITNNSSGLTTLNEKGDIIEACGGQLHVEHELGIDTLFMMPSVLGRIKHGIPLLDMTDLREVVVLFVAKRKTSNRIPVAAWFADVCDVLFHHRCSVTQVIEDDKGIHLVAAINLVIHESNAGDLALAAASELIDRGTGVSIGIAAGFVITGVVGGDIAGRYDMAGAPCVRACRLMEYVQGREPVPNVFVEGKPIDNALRVAIDMTVMDLASDATRVKLHDSQVSIKGSKTPISILTLTSLSTRGADALKTIAGFNQIDTSIHQRAKIEIVNLLRQHELDDLERSKVEHGQQSKKAVSPILLLFGRVATGKRTLAISTISTESSFVPLLYECSRGADRLALCKSLAAWCAFHPLQEVRAQAGLLNEAMDRKHIPLAMERAILLMETCVHRRLRIAVVIHNAQHLDPHSKALVESSAHRLAQYTAAVASVAAKMSSSGSHSATNNNNSDFLSISQRSANGGGSAIGSWLWVLTITPVEGGLMPRNFDASVTRKVDVEPLDAHDCFKVVKCWLGKGITVKCWNGSEEDLGDASRRISDGSPQAVRDNMTNSDSWTYPEEAYVDLTDPRYIVMGEEGESIWLEEFYWEMQNPFRAKQGPKNSLRGPFTEMCDALSANQKLGLTSICLMAHTFVDEGRWFPLGVLLEGSANVLPSFDVDLARQHVLPHLAQLKLIELGPHPLDPTIVCARPTTRAIVKRIAESLSSKQRAAFVNSLMNSMESRSSDELASAAFHVSTPVDHLYAASMWHTAGNVTRTRRHAEAAKNLVVKAKQDHSESYFSQSAKRFFDRVDFRVAFVLKNVLGMNPEAMDPPLPQVPFQGLFNNGDSLCSDKSSSFMDWMNQSALGGLSTALTPLIMGPVAGMTNEMCRKLSKLGRIRDPVRRREDSTEWLVDLNVLFRFAERFERCVQQYTDEMASRGYFYPRHVERSLDEAHAQPPAQPPPFSLDEERTALKRINQLPDSVVLADQQAALMNEWQTRNLLPRVARLERWMQEEVTPPLLLDGGFSGRSSATVILMRPEDGLLRAYDTLRHVTKRTSTAKMLSATRDALLELSAANWRSPFDYHSPTSLRDLWLVQELTSFDVKGLLWSYAIVLPKVRQG